MTFPKWKYRKHPSLGVFQSTLVASKEAESELLAEAPDWSDDPKSTGFEVRPAAQLHPTHFTSHASLLHEVVTEVVDGPDGKPMLAQIKMKLNGDTSHAA